MIQVTKMRKASTLCGPLFPKGAALGLARQYMGLRLNADAGTDDRYRRL